MSILTAKELFQEKRLVECWQHLRAILLETEFEKSDLKEISNILKLYSFDFLNKQNAELFKICIEKFQENDMRVEALELLSVLKHNELQLKDKIWMMEKWILFGRVDEAEEELAQVLSVISKKKRIVYLTAVENLMLKTGIGKKFKQRVLQLNKMLRGKNDIENCNIGETYISLNIADKYLHNRDFAQEALSQDLEENQLLKKIYSYLLIFGKDQFILEKLSKALSITSTKKANLEKTKTIIRFNSLEELLNEFPKREREEIEIEKSLLSLDEMYLRQNHSLILTALFQFGMLTAVERVAEKLLSLSLTDQEQIGIKYLVAVALLDQKAYERAIEFIDECLSVLPLVPYEVGMFMFLKADALEKNGKKREAKEIFKVVNELVPNFRNVRERLKGIE